MGKQIFHRAMSESLFQFKRGVFHFRLFGVDFRIIRAHDEQYQVCVNGSEIFRIIDHGAGNVAIMAV